MSSILIYGANEKIRKIKIDEILEKELGLIISENNPDLLHITKEDEKKSIGIGQIKHLNIFISEKPFANKNKAVVIEEANLLTEQAQNALLKILEEHPSNCHFILGAKNEKDMLETVVSRCKKIDLSRMTEKGETIILELIRKDIGERLVWAVEESENEREDVILHLEDMMLDLREEMLKTENRKLAHKFAKNIETLMKVKKDLEESNITLKLALEYIAVKL